MKKCTRKLPLAERQPLSVRERFQKIAALLNRARRPLSVHSIAMDLEVAEKTIARDLDFMRCRLNLPIIVVWKGRKSGHWLNEKVPLCRACSVKAS